MVVGVLLREKLSPALLGSDCLELPISCKFLFCKGTVVQISQGPAGWAAVGIWQGEDGDMEPSV